MGLTQRRSECCLGIDEIDRQHKPLISRIWSGCLRMVLGSMRISPLPVP
jgi:hypothetical protein